MANLYFGGGRGENGKEDSVRQEEKLLHGSWPEVSLKINYRIFVDYLFHFAQYYKPLFSHKSSNWGKK